MNIENTTFSGIGKDFGFCPYDIELDPLDYKGRRVFKGEEYYIFDVGGQAVMVHIEDVREYLDDNRLNVSCYEQLITLIEVYHDNYPFIA